jgi:FkbM family methyltransferase
MSAPQAARSPAPGGHGPAPGEDTTTRMLKHIWNFLQAGTLRNPSALYAVKWIGGRRELVFRSGYRYSCDRAHLATARELCGLAYHGGRLTADGSGPKPNWIVRPEENLLVTPSGIRFALDTLHHLIFAETFIFDIHFQGFDLRGKTVVDIGAHVGDTALYYAEKGAEVHAFEPDPENFAKLERNLALNPELARRIHPHAEAVGEDGAISFYIGLGGGSGMYATGGRPVRVPSVSLGTLLAREKLERPYLLKCDCKGCEASLVRQEAIAQFERVAIEYASELGVGSVEEFAAALTARGFPHQRIFKQGIAPFTVDKHGVLCAERAPGGSVPPT